ncbi:MAG: branched-chain amino acid ABC transporter permease [Spirochaetales bacterium]|nr:branched-chain amino acid ABC transporter permease [Spirochaetales bacterium]
MINKTKNRFLKYLPIIVIAVYFAGPIFIGEYLTYLITLMAIMAIVTQGLNVMIGYAGQFSFGQPGFMAFGAYIGAIVVSRMPWIPFPLTILIVALASALLGFIIGFPCLRLSGFYLAMATFGFSSAIFELINYLGPLTGGNEGMYAPAAAIGKWKLTSTDDVYYIAAITVVLVMIGVKHISKTRTGRAWNAIRDDEIAASSMGINLQREKLKVFAFGAVLAGVSGLFYSYLIRYIESSYFSAMGLSFFLIMVVGGTGRVFGPIYGSIFIIMLPQVFGGKFNQHMNLVYGIILVLFVLLAPNGFYGIWDKIRNKSSVNMNLRDKLFSWIKRERVK